MSTADQFGPASVINKKNMADQKSPDSGGKLTQFPSTRVKTIMKSSPDLVNISQDSVFLITKSTVSAN